ncbi:ZIP family zinc transporter [Anoxybacillus mongoliensis]|uniref:ZIP family zinc transporter n=1 Tax=Anoxybacillus mongoliensis TaxID=452565 RepID=A0A7W8N5N0_9BACL|nr:ZIP family metal transporter [Anoxybacillus mongoliensis]MBB5354136.1 ZIP family zinc transporter [Anoxybacillus mongoliensis]
MFDMLVGSTLSALATGAGAVPILFLSRSLTHKWRDMLLAFTAGIMMAASMLGLIPEALSSGTFFALAIGLCVGVFTLTLLENIVPHIDLAHTKSGMKMDQKAVLVLAAITLHNIPEGLSVGVSYASGEQNHIGDLIALAIGFQNAPEGLLVALFLFNQHISKGKAFFMATGTGLIELVASIIGFYLTAVVQSLVPYGLAFAAGAMLFIIYKELIPESHGDGNEKSSTYAFIIGLLVMVFLIETF